MANRDKDIKQAQKLYGQASRTGRDNDWAEYEATVDLFSMHHGVDLSDAYELIEKGPLL